MRILLADDHTLMREGLRAILEKHAAYEIVGEAANGRQALELARRLKPDTIVMDVAMPDLNGIEATRQILQELPQVKIVALSVNADRRYVLAMLSAGASGYLLKNAAAAELTQALEAVRARQKYVSPLVADAVVESAVRPASAEPISDPKLSAREREVLQLLAEGWTSKEIATKLDVALSTIETHRRQIMDKLSIHTVAELTKYAIRQGITSMDP